MWEREGGEKEREGEMRWGGGEIRGEGGSNVDREGGEEKRRISQPHLDEGFQWKEEEGLWSVGWEKLHYVSVGPSYCYDWTKEIVKRWRDGIRRTAGPWVDSDWRDLCVWVFNLIWTPWRPAVTGQTFQVWSLLLWLKSSRSWREFTDRVGYCWITMDFYKCLSLLFFTLPPQGK